MSSKYPIVIPTFDRPYYLIKVLEGLKKCDNLDKFKIYTFEDKKEPKNDYIFSLLDGKIEIERHINKTNLGCGVNIPIAISKVLENYDSCVVLEDDVVPAVDFLNMFLWYLEEYKDKDYIIQMHNRNSKEALQNEYYDDKCYTFNFFVPWGWGVTKRIWGKFSSNFNCLHYANVKGTWDIPFGMWCLKNKILPIAPIIGRTNNIGAVGTYQKNPKLHNETIKNNNYYNKKPIKKFVLLDKFFDSDEQTKKRYTEIGIFGGIDYKKAFKEF